MFRIRTLAAASAVCISACFAVSVGPALASGGSSSGGGGTVGGSVTSPAQCGNLSIGVLLNTLGYWEATGKTATSCDGLPVAISFSDSTPSDGCAVTIPTFFGLTYFKYGVRPPSRYASRVYATGACSGTSRTIDATLTDRVTGAILSTASTTWTAP